MRGGGSVVQGYRPVRCVHYEPGYLPEGHVGVQFLLCPVAQVIYGHSCHFLGPQSMVGGYCQLIQHGDGISLEHNAWKT